MRAFYRVVLLATAALLCAAFLITTESESQTPADVPVIETYSGSPCTPTLLWQADGDSAGDYFGFDVASEGSWDSNNDMDIAVGALLADEGIGPGGSCNVFCDSLQERWQYYWNPNSDFGRSVCFMGDIDHDQKGEVVIGAPGVSGAGFDSNGTVIVSGALTLIKFSWLGSGTGDKLGFSVDYCGDLDFDNYDDIIVGAPEAVGLLGPRTGYALLLTPELNAQRWRVSGVEPDALFGWAVAYVGDVGGDSYSVIVGSPRASVIGTPVANVGGAFVYNNSGMQTWRYYGEHTGDYFGAAVAGTGDLDGDNINEVIIGAHRADPGGMIDAGSVYVYSSATHSLLYRLDGTETAGNFGYSVAGLSDIDGDDVDDLAVGAHRADPGGRIDAGVVYVYSGQTGTPLWRIEGAAAGDLFGTSVSLRVDDLQFNSGEIVVGAFKTDPGGRVDAGSAYLFGCACDCTYNGDPAHDGVTDVLDVVGIVGDAFRGDPNDRGANCRYDDSDVDCSGACDVLDVVKVVNVAFRGANKATEFCQACQ